MGMIKRVELRNTLVIAFVVAMCIVFLIYNQMGFSALVSSTAGNQEVINSTSSMDNQWLIN